MNELILAKMRAGDWGEVVRLMREEYGPTPGMERREARSEMRYPQLTARLLECIALPLRSSKNEDFAFFRLMLR